MKIFVGIPVYDRKLDVKVVTSLLNERSISFGSGDDFHVQFLPSCSHAAMGRNQLAKEFLDSDCDKLFFLDADVSFEPGSLIKVAHMPFDFVGGAYRFKCQDEKYPVTWDQEKPELWANEYGLLEVDTLPGGFLSLSRRVFERLAEAFPNRKYDHYGEMAHCFFQFRFENGGLFGEDTLMCREWRSIGEKVYLYPELDLTHWDMNIPYKGNIGTWLKNRPQQDTLKEQAI